MDFLSSMEYINSFTHAGRPVKDLSRIKGLMNKLKVPMDNLRFVHIAGTNGKGSVLEYCSDVLIRAGYKTGQFTSPFIQTYCDRIRINGEYIPQEKVGEICEKVRDAVGEDRSYSQFEITFAIGMLYFASENCDIVFLETGIGGLLDATNIIKSPLVSVIASVSLDHTAILGDTVEKIAEHKLGIIKENCPCVISFGNKQSVLEMAKKAAAEKNSLLTIPDRESLIIKQNNIRGLKFSYKGMDYELSMCGEHQAENAALAIETLNILSKSFNISQDMIFRGLKSTRVPSRIEIVGTNPLIIIDGGHNEDGVEKFAKFLSEQGIKDAVGIFGMVKGKAVDEAVEKMAVFYSFVYCAEGYISNNLTGYELSEKFREKEVLTDYGDFSEVTKKALERAEREGKPLLISGSLYMTSAVRRLLQGDYFSIPQ